MILNTPLKKTFWIASGTLLLLLGYFYWAWKGVQQVSLPLVNCDLRSGPCFAEFPSGESICLRITPTNMPVLTSIMLEVRTPHDLRIKKMNIHFKGKDMNMGEFKYNFQFRKKGVYTAQTILPTCIHDEMIWQAILDINTHSIHYTVPFILVNEKPRPGIQS